MIDRYAADIPLGRVGAPDDVAEVVAFLCSEPAIALVGQVLQPNGGTTR
jgi:2-hydroxycyclohexanecarboxyl-CoA dehydrogenase